MPLQVLWVAVAIGLYSLVKTGVLDLIHEYKIGTEIFVTIVTLVAVFGCETVAGAVLMVIILIAEFIPDLNTDRAGSIKSLMTHNIRTIATLMIFTSLAELRLATPLVMIAAIARAARSGILVKGSVYLESLARVDAMRPLWRALMSALRWAAEHRPVSKPPMSL